MIDVVLGRSFEVVVEERLKIGVVIEIVLRIEQALPVLIAAEGDELCAKYATRRFVQANFSQLLRGVEKPALPERPAIARQKAASP